MKSSIIYTIALLNTFISIINAQACGSDCSACAGPAICNADTVNRCIWEVPAAQCVVDQCGADCSLCDNDKIACEADTLTCFYLTDNDKCRPTKDCQSDCNLCTNQNDCETIGAAGLCDWSATTDTCSGLTCNTNCDNCVLESLCLDSTAPPNGCKSILHEFECMHKTANPTTEPTPQPTSKPTLAPTSFPTIKPTTVKPTPKPTAKPTLAPSSVINPPSAVTNSPTSGCVPPPLCQCQSILAPVCCSDGITYDNECSAHCQCQFDCQPGDCPTITTTLEPTEQPTLIPTTDPTIKPTTVKPTPKPTTKPTLIPTVKPTLIPTVRPTTVKPTPKPTTKPSLAPTVAPSAVTNPPSTTANPTVFPTYNPTYNPTSFPTTDPTNAICGDNKNSGPGMPIQCRSDDDCCVGFSCRLKAGPKEGKCGRDKKGHSAYSEILSIVGSNGKDNNSSNDFINILIILCVILNVCNLGYCCYSGCIKGWSNRKKYKNINVIFEDSTDGV